MKKQDEHFLNIKKIYPGVTSVTKPIVSGLIHNVYIVDCANGKYICRFSKKDVAEHNLQISNLLQTHNIAAPRVSIYNCGKTYCETYPFIPGKTLYERLLEGLSDDKKDNVYRQLFDISYKIENIPYADIRATPIPLFSKCLRKVISVLNPSKKKLCHTDLHAKNVILDEKDNVRAILDLDSILPERISVARFIIMKDAKRYGYDTTRFSNMSKNINIHCFNLLASTTNIFGNIFSECLRKQMLKIRVK